MANLFPEDKDYLFTVTCDKCGHVSTFDRRVVCTERSAVVRGVEVLLLLTCQGQGCAEPLKVRVDCGDFL